MDTLTSTQVLLAAIPDDIQHAARLQARHETVDREFFPSNADDAISTSVSLQAPCNVFVKMVSLDSKREAVAFQDECDYEKALPLISSIHLPTSLTFCT